MSVGCAGRVSERSQGLGPEPVACFGVPQGSRVSPGLAAELEFVEITIIVVVVMVMVVVITCLLSHYKLSARSFIGRHSQGRRREDALSSVSALPLPSARGAPGQGARGTGGGQGARSPAALAQTGGRWPFPLLNGPQASGPGTRSVLDTAGHPGKALQPQGAWPLHP